MSILDMQSDKVRNFIHLDIHLDQNWEIGSLACYIKILTDFNWISGPTMGVTDVHMTLIIYVGHKSTEGWR